MYFNYIFYIYRLEEDWNPNYNQNYTYSDDVRYSKAVIMEIIFSFFLSIFGFFKTAYDLFIIKELTVFHLLFPEIIHQFIKDMIIMIYIISHGIVDKIQIIQFIFIALSNYFALIGFCIYLELIVIKCYGFDENIKENIILRSLLDTKETKNVNERKSNIGVIEDDDYITNIQ